ncbi:hypothetical protein B0H11DRAFT_2193869 [Mycena galericulata]|nr:hypothetical protein B0H11DRAFT_2193869 [Mycena galericulata]
MKKNMAGIVMFRAWPGMRALAWASDFPSLSPGLACGVQALGPWPGPGLGVFCKKSPGSILRYGESHCLVRRLGPVKASGGLLGLHAFRSGTFTVLAVCTFIVFLGLFTGSFRVEISTRFRRDFDSDFKSDFVTILRRTSGDMPGMLLQAALQPLFWMGGNEGGRGRMTAGYSARRGTGADKYEIMMVTESHLKSSSKSAANLSRNRLEICTVSDPIVFGISPNFAFYLVAVVNFSACVGRNVSGILADNLGDHIIFESRLSSITGAMNITTIMTALAGATTIAWPFCRTIPSITVISILYGSGAWFALIGQMGGIEDIGRRIGVINTIAGIGANACDCVDYPDSASRIPCRHGMRAADPWIVWSALLLGAIFMAISRHLAAPGVWRKY